MKVINDHLRTEDIQITRFYLSMYGYRKKHIPTNINMGNYKNIYSYNINGNDFKTFIKSRNIYL